MDERVFRMEDVERQDPIPLHVVDHLGDSFRR